MISSGSDGGNTRVCRSIRHRGLLPRRLDTYASTSTGAAEFCASLVTRAFEADDVSSWPSLPDIQISEQPVRVLVAREYQRG